MPGGRMPSAKAVAAAMRSMLRPPKGSWRTRYSRPGSRLDVMCATRISRHRRSDKKWRAKVRSRVQVPCCAAQTSGDVRQGG